MVRQQQRENWQDVKELWGDSSEGEKINFQFSTLIDELKGKMSQFEKDSIKSDMRKVKSSWNQFKGNVSQWEKDSVSKDLSKMSKLMKKIIEKLRRKNK